jgi:D-inositol-3-phosphate glycosyltransferase
VTAQAFDRLRVCFVVESGTDHRLVEGLMQRADLTILARALPGGRVLSQPATVPIEVGPSSRSSFGRFVLRRLLARSGRWDVVLVQGYALAALAANLAARRTGTPTLMLVCSPIEAYYRCRRAAAGPPFRWRELAGISALARVNARLARGYVVLSHYLEGVVRGHGARCDVHNIPVYGVDTARFVPAAGPRSTLRAALGLPATGQLLFFSSRTAPEKDVAALLDALVLLLDERRDVWLVNRSGGHAELLDAARRRGVAQRVLAADAVHPVTELPAYYQAVDLCVQASREEGLGFSVLEALACETPVVAAAVGGLRETILDGVTGWTYPQGDARALAAAIASALDDPLEADRRASAGRRSVVERFDATKAFDALHALLAGLARARSDAT